MTKRPVLDIPEEVASKYKEVTAPAIEEAFENGARAALRGVILGIEGEAQDIELSARIVSGGIEDAYDVLEEHLSEEHAKIFLGYVIANAQKLLGSS